MEIIGTVTDTFIAGRLEICVGGIWRAVYDDSWGDPEVRIVCQRRGFPRDGKNTHSDRILIIALDQTQELRLAEIPA